MPGIVEEVLLAIQRQHLCILPEGLAAQARIVADVIEGKKPPICPAPVRNESDSRTSKRFVSMKNVVNNRQMSGYPIWITQRLHWSFRITGYRAWFHKWAHRKGEPRAVHHGQRGCCCLSHDERTLGNPKIMQ